MGNNLKHIKDIEISHKKQEHSWMVKSVAINKDKTKFALGLKIITRVVDRKRNYHNNELKIFLLISKYLYKNHGNQYHKFTNYM